MDLDDPRYSRELERLAKEERVQEKTSPVLQVTLVLVSATYTVLDQELDFRDYMIPDEGKEERSQLIKEVQ